MKFKYCLTDEVIKNRKKIFMFKLQYLAKLMHLKQLGQKDELMNRLNEWLYENLEDKYLQTVDQ